MEYVNNPDNTSTLLSVPGCRNRERKAKCEDTALFEETGTLKFFGLADGQTGKAHCREGGLEALRAVFRYIAEKGITQMMQYEHVDEIQYEIIKLVRKSITELATAEHAEKSEFASTLVVFAYDTQTGNSISVHLGDGGIIGNKTGGEIRMISSPENGLTANYTWLTTSREALMHLRIGFGSIREYKRILLITDGASAIARGKNLTERAKGIIGNGSREDIAAFLEESNPVDDASCIVMDFDE